MPQPRQILQMSQGRTPRQAHRDLNGLIEDEMTRDGFDGPTTLFYRAGDPLKFRPENGRFHNVTFQSNLLKTSDSVSADGAPQRLFYNSDVTIYSSRRQESMPWYYRNVDGDECWFVHEGSGTVETEYGIVEFGVGDYVYLPKGTTRRWIVDSPLNLLGIETFDRLSVPQFGGIGRHAPFDTDLLRGPTLQEAVTELGEYRIRVKYDDEYSDIVSQAHPFDVLGWKSDIFPFAFNIKDWNVITSDSLHLPPSMHVFLANANVTLLNLLPRRSESVPGAERAPFHHRNVDYDEVSIAHGGKLFGAPVPKGIIDHSPQGIHHGFPQELHDAVRDAGDAYDRVEWEVIMVETRKPLKRDDIIAEQEQIHAFG